MRKCLTIRDHKALQTKLKELKKNISVQEIAIKSHAKSFVTNLAKKLFLSKPRVNPVTQIPIVQNPTGKLLAKALNKTIFRKEGLMTKLLTGFISKQVGKVVEQKLLKG